MYDIFSSKFFVAVILAIDYGLCTMEIRDVCERNTQV